MPTFTHRFSRSDRREERTPSDNPIDPEQQQSSNEREKNEWDECFDEKGHTADIAVERDKDRPIHQWHHNRHSCLETDWRNRERESSGFLPDVRRENCAWSSSRRNPIGQRIMKKNLEF